MAKVVGSAIAVALLAGCFDSADPTAGRDAAPPDGAGLDAGHDGGAPEDGGATPGCDRPVSAGEYTLHIIDLTRRGGFPFELRADGTFTGVAPLTQDRCEGSLTPVEAENLAAALNAANAFCHRDITDCSGLGEIDNIYVDIAVQTTELARDNRFCHVFCHTMPDEAMDRFLGVAQEAIFRVWNAGDCTPITYTPPTATDHCPPRTSS